MIQRPGQMQAGPAWLTPESQVSAGEAHRWKAESQAIPFVASAMWGAIRTGGQVNEGLFVEADL